MDPLFDAGQEIASPVRNHPEKLTSPQSVIAYRDSVVPDAHYDHNVADIHLLKHSEELVAGAVFAVVVEAFSQDLLLLDGVDLADSVRKNAVLSRCKLGRRLWIRNVAEVVDDEADLVLVRDGRTESLKLKLLERLTLA